MPRRIVVAVVVLIAALSYTSAASATDRSLDGDLAIADRYWASQGFENPCAGRVQITLDAGLQARGRGGEATGLSYKWAGGNDFDWYVDSCSIAIMPDTGIEVQCNVIVHEVGHLVTLSPLHTGPMAPENLHPTECIPTPCEKFSDLVRPELPPMPWTIECRIDGPRMRARAQSPDARYIRRWTGDVGGNGYFITWQPAHWIKSR